ncbi:maleylpyruvate isomerase N-terminal domain-containing protein [Chachezhania sediminis]|uniref:maleylpyruvate isomerase N-terminal domain-containing protein n=1 Tax=Chachezhania sediminis TaxID=2599291 RepID=UPI00131B575C|nr:maleylpyruvate isomerase N-terminal domain-containing protein [Chachezhania sediminis]
MTQVDDAARAQLRARQGAGARYDAEAAPHDDLLLARRGTAYFARFLNALPDADLTGPSLRDGWTRAHVVAHVSYHARALARLIAGARSGVPGTMYPSVAARDAEVELGATLPPRALRSLFQHSEIHLNVEWRDMDDRAWDAPVTLLDGSVIPARGTPRLRAHEIWTLAVDLGNGGRLADIPPVFRP